MSSLLKLDPTSNYWETTQNCPVQKKIHNKKVSRKSTKEFFFFFFWLINTRRRARKARDDNSKSEDKLFVDQSAREKKRKKKCAILIRPNTTEIVLQSFSLWWVINDERDKGFNKVVRTARKGRNVKLPSTKMWNASDLTAPWDSLIEFFARLLRRTKDKRLYFLKLS